jgi:hypothetical protein
MNNNTTSATLLARALRLALCGAALIACASNSIAQENPSPTPEAAPPDCKVNDPDIAASYSGECRNGLANGKGTATGRDKYVGEFRDGLEHGKGDYTWPNGFHYVGDWVNGKRTGKGVFTSPNGNRYEGDWVNSKYHGQGVLVSNGTRQEGYFADGKFIGKSAQTANQGNAAQNTAQAAPANAPSVAGSSVVVQAGAAQPVSAMQGKSAAELTNEELMPLGMWKDPKTGLIWDRCAVGQTWDGSTCTGTALLHATANAVKSVKTGGYNDWRTPTYLELLTIRKCPAGLNTISTRTIDGVTFAEWCNPKPAPPIDTIIFPGVSDYSVLQFVDNTNTAKKIISSESSYNNEAYVVRPEQSTTSCRS